MKVKELIALLQELDQELNVVSYDGTDDLAEIMEVCVENRTYFPVTDYTVAKRELVVVL